MHSALFSARARTHRSRLTAPAARLGALALLAPLACTAPQRAPEPAQHGPRAPAAPAQGSRAAAQTSVIGRSVENRSIELRTLGDGPENILILATIHGNESAGTDLLHHLSSHLENNPDVLAGRRVLLIPVANPDGLARRTRGNARGVDLNRNFPAANFATSPRHGRKPLSEPESLAIHRLIEAQRPHRIVSIHQPLACIDYDGPAAAMARAMAEAGPLPIRKSRALPGSLGSFAGEALHIPVITLELPGSASRRTAANLWHDYGPMLLAAVDFDASTPTRAARRFWPARSVARPDPRLKQHTFTGSLIRGAGE